MTREEAIECLNFQNEKFFGGQSEALKMAISAMSEELSEDGTLTVHVADGSKVSRVFVKGDNIFGGLYYPDSDFAGMTNGEVIKVMFPNETMFEQTEAVAYYGNMRFDTSWWNAPYKGVSE